MIEHTTLLRQDVRLSFAPDIADQPLVCNLVRDYDLTFSILKAQITPRKEGHMTLELLGTAEHIHEGVAYLKRCGVKVTSVAQQVRRDEVACMQCGMCVALCASHALSVDMDSREVHFAQERCTACGQCARICPVHAMSMDVRQDAL